MTSRKTLLAGFIFLKIALSILLLVLVPTFAYADNLVSNGNFESSYYDNDWGERLPLNWHPHEPNPYDPNPPDPNAPWKTDLKWMNDGIATSGSAVVRHEHNVGGYDTMWWQDVGAGQFNPGEPVLISSKVRVGRTRGGSGGVRLALHWHDGAGNTIKGDESGIVRGPIDTWLPLEIIRTVPDGTYKLRVHLQQTDYIGASRFDDAKVIVDRTDPVVTINTPVNDQKINGRTFTITGSARDPASEFSSGVKQVEVSIDYGDWQRASGTNSWQFNWPLPQEDEYYSIRVRAVDFSKNFGPSTDINVFVNNEEIYRGRMLSAISLANPSIKVATYNIWSGYSDSRIEPRPLADQRMHLIAENVERLGSDLDVIGFNEVRQDNAVRLYNCLQGKGYRFALYGRTLPFKKRAYTESDIQKLNLTKAKIYGNLILSRKRLSGIQNFQLYGGAAESRGLLKARVNTSSRDIQFFSTHLASNNDLFSEWQAKDVLLFTSWFSKQPRIIVGDLNSGPSGYATYSRAFNKLSERYQSFRLPEVEAQEGTQRGSVWIDHIFSTSSFSSGGVQSWGPIYPHDMFYHPYNWPSDHRPVWAQVGIPKVKSTAGKVSSLKATSGQTLSKIVSVDANTPQVTFATTWEGSNVQLTLIKPDGLEVDASIDDQGIYHDKGATYELYRVDNPQPGQWLLQAKALDMPESGEEVLLGELLADEFDTVDITPPSTSLQLTPPSPNGNNGWYKSLPSATLTATDNHPSSSGVKATYYDIEQASLGSEEENEPTEDEFPESTELIYFEPFVINEGRKLLNFFSDDNAENTETVNIEEINVDITPPNITGAPTTLSNINDWYNSDVAVHFDATDVISGVAIVTPDQIISTEGALQSITGWATDVAGNSASTTVGGINIDKTAPATTAMLRDTSLINGQYNLEIVVNLLATDNLSGIAKTEYSLDGGITWNLYSLPFILGLEDFDTILYRSTDFAENVESIRISTFNIDEWISGNTSGRIIGWGGYNNPNLFNFNILSNGLYPIGTFYYSDRANDVNFWGNIITNLIVSFNKKKAVFRSNIRNGKFAGYKFVIYVNDNGNPGINDKFKIKIYDLSNLLVYSSGGTIFTGNIQIYP